MRTNERGGQFWPPFLIVFRRMAKKDYVLNLRIILIFCPIFSVYLIFYPVTYCNILINLEYVLILEFAVMLSDCDFVSKTGNWTKK